MEVAERLAGPELCLLVLLPLTLLLTQTLSPLSPPFIMHPYDITHSSYASSLRIIVYPHTLASYSTYSSFIVEQSTRTHSPHPSPWPGNHKTKLCTALAVGEEAG